MRPETLDFYRSHGPLSRSTGTRIAELPAEPRELASAVQGLLLHEHVAPAYGVTLTPERRLQSHLRSVPEILHQVFALNGAPLTHPRPLEGRVVGTCRNFTLLGVAALREHGVPARARCGFAAYFDPGKFVDHWVVEYWNPEEQRWVLVDLQLDTVQREAFTIGFDTLDVPRDQFLVAGQAWERCRSGEADPASFGIMELSGSWFIAGNVIRDLASLNKVEMLPWDVWGVMPPAPEDVDSVTALVDCVAGLLRDPDENFAELRRLYAQHEGLRVPGTVFNALLNRPEEWT